MQVTVLSDRQLSFVHSRTRWCVLVAVRLVHVSRAVCRMLGVWDWRGMRPQTSKQRCGKQRPVPIVAVAGRESACRPFFA
jgi:hypothetical protein